MNRVRYISVPKDKKAMDDYDYGKESPQQNIEWILNSNEFDILWNLGVFNELNCKCDIIIDDFEAEVITYDKLHIAAETIENILTNIKTEEVKAYEVILKLQKMILTAIEVKTLIAFDF